MNIWEVFNDRVDDVAGLVIPVAEQSNLHWWDKFGGDGSVLNWRRRPSLELRIARGRKKPKPRADLSPFMPGALVLSASAYDALGSFLSSFGQLLELSVEGQVEYFYNVTHVLACIDPILSVRRPEGTIATEVFDMAAVPAAPSLFKDRLNLGKIYVNDAGKTLLENLVVERGITGMCFKVAGQH